MLALFLIVFSHLKQFPFCLMSYHFRPILTHFCSLWYDGVVLHKSVSYHWRRWNGFARPTEVGTTGKTQAKTGTTMGTIIKRTRKDGSKAFTAQIVIKKDGKIVHREAETFDRKQAANAWIVKREAELKAPRRSRKEGRPYPLGCDRSLHGNQKNSFR